MAITPLEKLENNCTENKQSGINVIDLEVIENKLFKILEDDKKLESPVFLFIKEDAISRLAYFLSGAVKRPVAIGIAGETASGKSTFTLDIINAIENFQFLHNLPQLITRVNTDDYYYDRSDMVKKAGSFAAFAKNYDLDIPEAFELDLLKRHIEQLVMGNSVMLPKYDMSGTAKRYDNSILAAPSSLILSEGLFTLTSTIKDAFDFCIYVDVSREMQKGRFFRRAAERNLGEAAEGIYNNAVSKAEIHIKPSVVNADIIINGEASREDYVNAANRFLDIIEYVYLSKVII